MFDDSFAQDLVEVGGFDFLMSGCVNLGGKLKKFSDVMAGLTTGDEHGSIGDKIEVVFEFVEDGVGVIDKVGFS